MRVTLGFFILGCLIGLLLLELYEYYKEKEWYMAVKRVVNTLESIKRATDINKLMVSMQRLGLPHEVCKDIAFLAEENQDVLDLMRKFIKNPGNRPAILVELQDVIENELNSHV